MKAKELIKILEENPENEIVIFELGKHIDNAPLLPVHSVEVDNENIIDEENKLIIINFHPTNKVHE